MSIVDYIPVHPYAELPIKVNNTDPGLSVIAADISTDRHWNVLVCDTGLQVKVPSNYYLEIKAPTKLLWEEWMLCSGSDFVSGEPTETLKFYYRPVNPDISIEDEKPFGIGDIIGQLILVPCADQTSEKPKRGRPRKEKHERQTSKVSEKSR